MIWRRTSAASSLTVRGQVILAVLRNGIIRCWAIGHGGKVADVSTLAVCGNAGLVAVSTT